MTIKATDDRLHLPASRRLERASVFASAPAPDRALTAVPAVQGS